MKDITPAARARAAFLRAVGGTENLFEDLPLVLDLYTLLILTKGRQCEPEDVELAEMVAGLRYGANPPYSFDALDDSISDDAHRAGVQDDWMYILSAAAMLEEEPGDNIRPLRSRPVPFPGTQGTPDGSP